MPSPVLNSVVTSDLEQARQVLSELYVDNELRMGADPGVFSVGLHWATAGPVHVGRMQFGPSFQVKADPVVDLLVVTPLAGSMVLSHAEDVVLDAATPGMVPRGTDFGLDVSADFCELAVPLPMAAVTDVATAAYGDRASDLRFSSVTPIDRARARSWTATLLFVERQLRAPDSLLGSPLVQAETLGLLAAHALQTFPHTALALAHLPGPGWLGPRSVRRAMAFIEEHAAEPLTVTEIAAAAQVSARVLQNAFRRHLDTTPLGHLRNVRMGKAHEQLRREDPAAGTTVRQVAAAWGFSDLHRFTVVHCDRFGQHPAQTLRATDE